MAPLAGAGITMGCLHLGHATRLPASSSLAAKPEPQELHWTLIGIALKPMVCDRWEGYSATRFLQWQHDGLDFGTVKMTETLVRHLAEGHSNWQNADLDRQVYTPVPTTPA